MKSSHGRTSTVLIAAVVGLSACGGSSKPGGQASIAAGTNPAAVETNPGGDIPDSQAFVAFRDPGRRFTVTVAEGWARTNSATGTTLFSDKYNSIRIETVSTASRPTVESARAGELPAIQAAARGFTAGTITIIDRKAGSAVLIAYRANSAPNAVTGMVAFRCGAIRVLAQRSRGGPQHGRAGRVGQHRSVAHPDGLVRLVDLNEPGDDRARCPPDSRRGRGRGRGRGCGGGEFAVPVLPGR